MSTLFVNNISHTNDTSAMTIDTSGTILTPARPFMLLLLGMTTSQTGITGFTEVVLTPHTTNIGGHYSTSTGRFTVPHFW